MWARPARRDPHAPVMLIRNRAQPDTPGINIFEHDGTLRMNQNCSVEELDGSRYSRARERSDRGWIDVPSEYVRTQTISGHRLPMSFPAQVDEMVLDIPADNPSIEIIVTGDSRDHQ